MHDLNDQLVSEGSMPFDVSDVRVCAGLVAGAGLAYGNFWMVGVAAVTFGGSFL